MATPRCPKCSHDLNAEAAVCPACGHSLNGAVPPAPRIVKRPPPPPGFPPIEPIPPELLEWARRTFDEEEFRAGLREIEETGGLTFEELMRGLEEEIDPRE